MKTKDLNRFKGCLFGGAIGDALGYAVEFQNIEQIREQYGPQGITDMELVNGTAIISDDTQMTLFTANGILVSETLARLKGDERDVTRDIHNAYMDWHRTQRFSYDKRTNVTSWLYNVSALHSVRAPGGTCLRSLAGGTLGTIEHPVNSSKGCGGLMRCAPVGLYFDRAHYSLEQVEEIAARSAALTHGHQLGYLPAAALAHMINEVVYGDETGDDALYDIAETCIRSLQRTFADKEKLPKLVSLMQEAIALSRTATNDVAAIASLGEGWVAEEAFAIALYCALKYRTDFRAAMIAAVNHSGDSDSTGSVTGNLLGAYLGFDRLPASYLEHLELKQTISVIASDLFALCATEDDGVVGGELWQKKYVKADYRI